MSDNGNDPNLHRLEKLKGTKPAKAIAAADPHQRMASDEDLKYLNDAEARRRRDDDKFRENKRRIKIASMWGELIASGFKRICINIVWVVVFFAIGYSLILFFMEVERRGLILSVVGSAIGIVVSGVIGWLCGREGIFTNKQR